MKIELIPLQIHGDERGSLVSLETKNNIPFEIKRVYYLFDTLKGVTRGFHAHKALKQLAIVLRGSCRFILDDGSERISVLLDNPTQGLLIESFMWREMECFSPDCLLLVLADQEYDESDYVRDYDQFKKMVKNVHTQTK